jgi:hypothetical protein
MFGEAMAPLATETFTSYLQRWKIGSRDLETRENTGI